MAIRLPKGPRTSQGFAPATIARSAAESAAPWAWRGLAHAFFALGRGYRDFSAFGRNAEVSNGAPAPDFSVFGPSFKFDGADSLSVPYEGPTGGSARTVVCLFDTTDGGDRTLVRWGSEDGGDAGGAWRLRLEDGELWLRVYSGSKSWQSDFKSGGPHALLVTSPDNGSLTNTTAYANGVGLPVSGAGSQTLNTEAGNFLIGVDLDSIGGSFGQRDFFNRKIGAILTYDRHFSSMGEIQAILADPFLPIRRRPLFIPVSSGGGGATLSEITDASGASDTWAALISAPVSLAEPASASDTYSAIATVATSLTEAIAAQDSDAGPAQALGSITGAATGNDLADAVAQASVAITAGAAAGESWVAQAQAVVDLIEAGAASDTITQAASSAQQAAVTEGSSAGDTFAAAIQAVASLTESASASAQMNAVSQAQAAISDGVAAGETWTATAQVAVDLVESGAAGDAVTQAVSTAQQAAIAEGSTASEAFLATTQALSTVTEPVSAADALIATVAAMGAVTESAQAGSAFAATSSDVTRVSITQATSASDSNTVVAQVISALTEAIDAAAIYAASASVTATITASAQAGDSWSAVVPGSGYLVAAAITITAALSGSVSINH